MTRNPGLGRRAQRDADEAATKVLMVGQGQSRKTRRGNLAKMRRENRLHRELDTTGAGTIISETENGVVTLVGVDRGEP